MVLGPIIPVFVKYLVEMTSSLDIVLYAEMFIKELGLIAKKEKDGNRSNSPNYKDIDKSWYIYMLVYYVITFSSDYTDFLMTQSISDI